MLRFAIQLAALAGGMAVWLGASGLWSFLGLGVVVGVVLGMLGIGRRPVTNWEPGDAQEIVITAAGPRRIDVIKVLREYIDDPEVPRLKAQLESVPANVGQVPSEAAAQDLAAKLADLQTTVSFHPVASGN